MECLPEYLLKAGTALGVDYMGETVETTMDSVSKTMSGMAKRQTMDGMSMAMGMSMDATTSGNSECLPPPKVI